MIPPAVLAAYPPAVRDCHWVPLPPGGGLNGGRVWRGEFGSEPLFALKRWPISHVSVRLQAVHERMRQVVGLDFVPKLVNTLAGPSFVEHDSRRWDVTTWMPGTNCFSDSSEFDTLSALRAIGQLHHCWWPVDPKQAQCVAVRRQLMLLSDWRKTRLELVGPYREVRELTAASEVVGRRVTGTLQRLLDNTFVKSHYVPTHGDYWPENVHFVGHRVSAVLDFGNTSYDSPEADVARFLADLPPISTVALHSAAEVYESANPGIALSVPLLRVLIDSGRVCSLARWLMRLNAADPPPLSAALPRVRLLVALISDADRTG